MNFTAEDYCELLGLYLGDGCIVESGRTQRLRITLDNKYPLIIEETCALLRRCFVRNEVSVVPASKGGCSHVSVYSGHLACVLPQHGVGRKHTRPIELEPWQQTHVGRAPWSLLKV